MDVLLTAFLCGLFFVSIEPVCVSVGPFNPFIFQVIIDMHDTIIIYFIILGFFFFFSCLFTPFYFLPGEHPFIFVVKLLWWC